MENKLDIQTESIAYAQSVLYSARHNKQQSKLF